MGNDIYIKVNGFDWEVFTLLRFKEQELNRKYAGSTMTTQDSKKYVMK